MVSSNTLFSGHYYLLSIRHLYRMLCKPVSLDFMFYADNTQIYISNNNPIHPVQRTSNNMLMCNLEKLKYCISYPDLTFYETLANTVIAVKTNAKNLGVILEETLSFTEHTNGMYEKASYAINLIILVIFKSIFHSVDLKCW